MGSSRGNRLRRFHSCRDWYLSISTFRILPILVGGDFSYTWGGSCICKPYQGRKGKDNGSMEKHQMEQGGFGYHFNINLFYSAKHIGVLSHNFFSNEYFALYGRERKEMG